MVINEILHAQGKMMNRAMYARIQAIVTAIVVAVVVHTSFHVMKMTGTVATNVFVTGAATGASFVTSGHGAIKRICGSRQERLGVTHVVVGCYCSYCPI
jgi:hypothetical protein